VSPRASTEVGEMPFGEPFRIDDPDNHCFGCSPHNPSGLALEFVRTSEHVVEVAHEVDPVYCGSANVVHGGIQATLLDEAIGVASHTAFPGERARLVTVEFNLRYRLPVRAETPIVIRGEMLRREGRDVWLKGAILNELGERLTVAEARWRRID